MTTRYASVAVTLAAVAALTAPYVPKATQKLDQALSERLAVSEDGSVRVIVRALLQNP